MGFIAIFIIIIFRIMYSICYKGIGLSIITTIFITLAFCSIIFCIVDIAMRKKAKEKINKAKLYKATIVSKEEIEGYKARAIYTFELRVGDTVIQIDKDNIHTQLEENQTIDVYPIYDEQNNIVGLDLVDDIKINAEKHNYIYTFTIVTILASVYFILTDKTIFTTVLSNIISSMLLLMLFMGVGIKAIKRANIDKNKPIPIKAVIHGIRTVTHYDSYTDSDIILPRTYTNPIYRVEINGKTYQYLGDKHVKETDKDKEVTIFYDKDTMEFFEEPKSNTDAIIGIVMIGLSICIIHSLLKLYI